MRPHDVLHGLVRRRCDGATPGHALLVGWHARVYDRFVARWVLGGLYRAVAAEVAAAVPDGGAVLDVGTGPGRLLVELARRRPDVRLVGIDPSPDMVGRARRNVHAVGLGEQVQVCVAAAEALPFLAESFDAVTSTLSAHHWADVAAAVGEQARVLRLGARLWVYDHRGASAAPLTTAITAEFTSPDTGRLTAGRVTGVAVTRHRATKGAA